MLREETLVVYPNLPTMATSPVSAEKPQGAQTLLTLTTQPYRYAKHKLNSAEVFFGA